jgi:hypothetical protein
MSLQAAPHRFGRCRPSHFFPSSGIAQIHARCPCRAGMYQDATLDGYHQLERGELSTSAGPRELALALLSAVEGGLLWPRRRNQVARWKSPSTWPSTMWPGRRPCGSSRNRSSALAERRLSVVMPSHRPSRRSPSGTGYAPRRTGSPYDRISLVLCHRHCFVLQQLNRYRCCAQDRCTN